MFNVHLFQTGTSSAKVETNNSAIPKVYHGVHVPRFRVGPTATL